MKLSFHDGMTSPNRNSLNPNQSKIPNQLIIPEPPPTHRSIHPLTIHSTMPKFLPHFHLFFATILAMVSLPTLNQATVRIIIGTCHASSFIKSKGGYCLVQTAASCCQAGQMYRQFRCSPPVTSTTAAIMYKMSFSNTAAKCENKTYTDSDVVVALSTGWYNGGSRCLRNITIDANNGNSVTAQVVGECDSWNGCDAVNGNTPPCVENVVMASPAVWEQLGVPQSQRNELDITWSDVS